MPKVIVITGASSGIGAALAERLGRDGHAVVLAARRAKELRDVADRCGARAMPVVTDVTQRALVNNLRDAAIRRFGGIDVWVNNAGRGIGKKVLELTEEDLDAMMAVNVKSALYGMQAVVPHFQERGRGHLVNVSSFLGRVPLVTVRSAYSAAKAALNSLTANLRMDLRATHPEIHVTLVLPGVVTTDFARNVIGTVSPPVTAAGAAQTPEQVAACIADAIANPVAELFTNPAQPQLARAYQDDVAAFEAHLASQPGGQR